jgi:hypothetical protein
LLRRADSPHVIPAIFKRESMGGVRRAPAVVAAVDIGSRIVTVRGYRVILDADLARIYGVPTKRLNEQVKRNAKRFPSDFMFRLTNDEVGGLRSQFATAKNARGGRRTPPYAFTEHGALMAANVLNSNRAAEMSVYVIRAFVLMRTELALQQDLAKRLAEIERTLIGHDGALRDLYAKIRALLLPLPAPPRRRIGFRVKEAAARYRAARGQRQQAGA